MKNSLGILVLVVAVATPMFASDRVVSFGAAKVDIESDSPDRLWVLVDRDGDDTVDRLYAVTSSEAAYPREVLAEVPRSLRPARITVAPGYLSVEGLDWSLTSRLEREGPVERASAVGSGVELSGFAALTRIDLPGDEPVGFEAARRLLPELQTVENEPQGLKKKCPKCRSGGMGTTKCEASCFLNWGGKGEGASFGLAADFSTSSGCASECAPGYYSCCNCGLGLAGMPGAILVVPVMKSSCVCKKNDPACAK